MKSIQEILTNYGIDYVDAKDDLLIRCPFHNDQNPSLSVKKMNGIFHCWSCGAKGNIISFVMMYEHITYNEAKDKVYGEKTLTINNQFQYDVESIEKSITELYIDKKYYQFKQIMSLLFVRDKTNLKLRKQLTEFKGLSEFKPILYNQSLLKNNKIDSLFNLKITIFQYLSELMNKRYTHPNYKLKNKYKFFLNLLKENGLTDEINIVLNFIESNQFREKYQLKYHI